MDSIKSIIKDLIPESIKNIPIHMDFEGQKRAERLFQVIILIFGIVGFIWGYYVQQFSQTFYILTAGFIFSCFLTLPPWPMFRKNPLKWQPVISQDTIEAESKNLPKSKKKK